MKQSVKIANALTALLIALVPFHAFLTVWGSSIVGHYVMLRLWTGVVLAILCCIVGYWVARDRVLRKWLLGNLLARFIGAYMVLSIALGLIGLAFDAVTLKALAYGLFSNLRYLMFFVAVMVVAHESDWLGRYWRQILLAPGLAVSAFAIAQYTVLPVKFLEHFGYSTGTIPAYTTINSNQEYIRVASTLRGANPLGAYLVVLISTLVALTYRVRQHRALMITYSLLAFAAMLFSFSRSAWLGILVALAIGGYAVMWSRKARAIFVATFLALCLVGVGTIAIAQHNQTLQNAVLHTDDESKVARSSNQERVRAQKEGLEVAFQNPFGLGVGAAGPASNYNSGHRSIITENYFLQLAIEIGWAGMLLFVAILVLLAQQLWRVRHESLGLALFMSLVGLTLVNVLSHAWTDDTLAYVWWGLAGVTSGLVPATRVATHKKQSRHAKVV